MKIGKKFYLLMAVIVALLLGSIPFLGKTNAIKASSDEYKLEIVRVQEYNQLVSAKLNIPKLSGQKILLKAEGIDSLHADDILSHLSNEDFERLSITKTDDENTLAIEFVDDGKSFESPFSAIIDRNSQLKKGHIQFLTEDGQVLAEDTFDINNTNDSEVIESDDQSKDVDLVDIATFGLTLPTPGTIANVSDWADFELAMASPTVDWINIKADLVASSAVSNVSVSKVINGNDNGVRRKIDMRDQKITLSATATGAQLILTDVDLTGSAVDPMFSAVNTAASTNWTFVTNNVNVLSGNERSLAQLENGGIQLFGENNFQSGGFVLSPFLRAKTLLVEEDATVEGNLQTIFFETLVDNSTFKVNNAKMNIWVDAEAPVVKINSKQAKMNFIGQKTDVMLSGNISSTAWSTTNPNKVDSKQGGAVVAIWDVREASDAAIGSEISIDDGAKVTFESRETIKGAPTLQIYSRDSKIVTSNEAEFALNSASSDSASNTALLRYEDPALDTYGNHQIKATFNSKVKLNKTGGATPVIRMYGNANKIDIQSGADFILHNVGSGVPQAPGANNGNQGIQYRNGASDETSSFSVTGEDSNVSISADNGAAIDCNNQMLNINASEGTYFVVRGNTPIHPTRGETAIFSNTTNTGTRNKLTFNMVKPKYFDFRNNSGGLLFSGNDASKFSMEKSDLQVWDYDKVSGNLDGNPTNSWNMLDAVWTGVDLGDGVSATTSSGSAISNLGTMKTYSRITANNQTPSIDELRVPTDADKYIWGHATVPEGKHDPIRAAYTGEVAVKVSVSGVSSVAAYTTKGTVVEDPAGTGTVSVYGDDARTGIFKIPTFDSGFLVKGQQIEVETAWRGALEDEGKSNVHTSELTDIKTPLRTVLDVTPPQPTKLTDESLNNATNVLSGTGAEVGATVYVYYDNGNRDSGMLLGTSTVLDDGTWSYMLPYYLTDAKELSVYLGDSVIKHTAAEEQVTSPSGETPVLYDQIGLIKPPVTNLSGVGNINPYSADYTYHDAVFECVKKYIVADVLPNLPVMTKTVLSSNGSVANADAGDVLTYTLTAKNNRPASVTTTWKDVMVTDTLSPKLTFSPATSALAINGTPATYVTGTPGVNEYSYDEGTRLLTVNLGGLTSAVSAQITFKATVSGSASGSIDNTATALGTSPRFEDGPGSLTGKYEEISASDSATITVAGTISLVSVPSSIDFKTEEAKLNEDTKVIDPDITGDFIVSDNRVTRKSWTITARLLTPMMPIGETDIRYVLPKAVRYNDGTDEIVIDNAETPIISHTHDRAGEYDISSRWSETGEGFKFYAAGGSVNKLGKYQAVLEFKLSATP
ncbi:pectate lyase-like adhesive domain-containing protein [Candidatus Enterococcus clewellii]|uniref:DUF11 domain-containing protein n=1 Tax=Candidatus Enterococcus clewellii TaxID=1834193 RepID=A0A242K4X1_9ENTE|nr:pectate lyase-like adhesive domain-containing protein [Enterococcus sp. 9E7_DIV0242]OTP14577.1 hypothetical protein A5888_002678 [Enterococcus sp. 9E7_DIV0242]